MVKYSDFPEYCTEHIGTGSKVARPYSITDALGAQGGHRTKMLREFRKNRRARRSNQLVGFVPLPNGDPPKNLECCRSGNGKPAMLALDPTTPFLQFGGVNSLDPQGLYPNAGTHDVRYRIQSAHLVKMHLLRGRSVDFRLGDRNPVKNSE